MCSEISVYIFDLSLEVSDYRVLLYQAKTVKEIAGAAVLLKTLILIQVKSGFVIILGSAFGASICDDQEHK